jgi:hypothetical protein
MKSKKFTIRKKRRGYLFREREKTLAILFKKSNF